jgi:hypothetical protein
MDQYRVEFYKRLCNHVGLERKCLQAIVDVHRAKSAQRALQAAQKRFERSRRNVDWRVYADVCEITSLPSSAGPRSVQGGRAQAQ